jgi:GNAT superfamily N-acetyltransferase
VKRKLRDGTKVDLRPLQPDDVERLRRTFDRLSPLSVYRRFMTPLARPSEAGLRRLADVDHRRREAVVATSGDEIVGVARYSVQEGDRQAEIAVVVEDAWQHRGLALLLLRRLAELARRRHLDEFTATILGDNRPAASMVRRLSPEARFSVRGGEIAVTIPLHPIA